MHGHAPAAGGGQANLHRTLMDPAGWKSVVKRYFQRCCEKGGGGEECEQRVEAEANAAWVCVCVTVSQSDEKHVRTLHGRPVEWRVSEFKRKKAWVLQRGSSRTRSFLHEAACSLWRLQWGGGRASSSQRGSPRQHGQ